MHITVLLPAYCQGVTIKIPDYTNSLTFLDFCLFPEFSPTSAEFPDIPRFPEIPEKRQPRICRKRQKTQRCRTHVTESNSTTYRGLYEHGALFTHLTYNVERVDGLIGFNETHCCLHRYQHTSTTNASTAETRNNYTTGCTGKSHPKSTTMLHGVPKIYTR